MSEDLQVPGMIREIDELALRSQMLIAEVAVANLFDCPEYDDVLADAWLKNFDWAVDIVCLREDYDMANCKDETSFSLSFDEFAKAEEPLSYFRYWQEVDAGLDLKNIL